LGTPILTALTLAERSTPSTVAADLSPDAGLRQAKIALIDFDGADFDQRRERSENVGPSENKGQLAG